MSLTTAELEQLLRLALAALQANAGSVAPGVQAAAAQAVASLAAAAPASVSPAAPTAPAEPSLADWLKTYEGIISQRGYKDQTVRNRRTTLAHVRRLWGERPLRALKAHEVVSVLRKEFVPEHTSTAHRVLAELRDVYTEAIANGEAEMNPATYCKLPTHHVCRQRLRWETMQSMLRLAEASRQTWVLAMLLLALVTGQRRADLAKMRFDDVITDADGERFLRIEQQKHAGKGYGARVEIPLSLRLDVIGMSVGDVIKLCSSCGAPGPTLLRKAGGGPIELSSLSTRFAETLAAVLGDTAPPVHVRPTLHEARSLSARLYLAQGMEPQTLQTLLGHKHAEMTAIYTDDRGLSAHEWRRVRSAA